MAYTVAIDGPAASGKGTLARALAAHFGFAHLDTGLLYRAVGARMLDGIEPLAAARALRADDLDPALLRTQAVAEAASKVAARPEVRQALLDFQRAFARRSGGAVLDGRDIGTVICPEAETKLFITASAEVRARRRFLELIAAGQAVTEAEVLADVRQRDDRDMNRADAPLRAADDAVRMDTTEMGIDAVLEQAVALIAARIPG
ncbi:MAG: cytidylate kinase [Rhodobacteraceae bacterium]|nr:cytidylate kinase [Paracoccaceae bacterium]